MNATLGDAVVRGRSPDRRDVEVGWRRRGHAGAATPAPLARTEPVPLEVLTRQLGVPREAITPEATLGQLLALARPTTP